MLTAKIDLMKLPKVGMMTGKAGQPVLVIDVDECKLYKADSGAIYLDLIFFESKSEFADFSIKQSLSKEQNEADKAVGIQRPFLGNMKDSSKTQSKPSYPEKVQEVLDEEGDGLPF